jgi:hypothetical protein
VFDAIFAAGSVLSESDREADGALEISIRLLEARRMGQVPVGCQEAVEFLAEECGLYPYVEADNFGLLTQSVIEAHSIDLHGKVYLHSKQMQVLLWLLEGDNVILSAPTSFGKSLLLDAFIARKAPHTVVAILPTIALIDETRRRILRSFQDRYKTITTTSEEYDRSVPTIFILTQERFLQRSDIKEIDLLFVDEFYKLDPDRDDSRFENLNLAVYRALPRTKQCFMAGPHVRGIDLGPNWRGNFRFVQTDYKTVTVNIVDRSSGTERFETFMHDLAGVGNENSLVFTATPITAQKLLNDIIDSGIKYPTELGASLGNWIAKNYHKEWPIAHGTQNGIAVHHGRLPRSLGQLFVHLFDAGSIKVLICTSTLIEGVNTSAANVFIYDKKINRSDFDFFSFANIRGRVGRMMRHFIGNAFLYHEPPEEIETRVNVPVLSDPNSSTDFILVNVERGELSPAGQERQDRLATHTGISLQILRDHGGIGVELLAQTFTSIKSILDETPGFLIWTGIPNKEQRKAVAELALRIAHARREQTGLHTPAQVGWAWSQLRSTKTLGGFLRWFARTFFSEDAPAGVDAAFQFLQACEFSFPRSIAAIEALVLHANPGAAVNYSPFITLMENWFRPSWIKQLDEAGIPVPLSERLGKYIGPAATKADALNAIKNLRFHEIKDLDEIDRFILAHALEV